MGFKGLANAMQSLVNVFKRPSVNWTDFKWVYRLSDDDQFLERTNYLCPKCGVKLYLIGPDGDRVYYKCVDCNKVFSVYKDNVLGTFKIVYKK